MAVLDGWRRRTRSEASGAAAANVTQISSTAAYVRRTRADLLVENKMSV